jgi:hypothetical protein
MALIFVFFHPFNFFQDSTYPGTGVSGGTVGHRQLHNSFFSQDNPSYECRNQKTHQYADNFFHFIPLSANYKYFIKIILKMQILFIVDRQS